MTPVRRIFLNDSQFSLLTLTVIWDYDSSMLVRVDYKSGKPIYLQVVDQVRHAAASGQLGPGKPLPSIRPLAEELRVNRNTIAKAYSELENQGVIETLPGKGSFVCRNDSPFTEAAKKKLLVSEIDQAVVMAHHLQVDAETFLELVRERLGFYSPGTTGLNVKEPE